MKCNLTPRELKQLVKSVDAIVHPNNGGHCKYTMPTTGDMVVFCNHGQPSPWEITRVRKAVQRELAAREKARPVC
jgi:hypothetical protein